MFKTQLAYGLVLISAWPMLSAAQNPAPTPPVPAIPASAPAAFRSALEDYQPYTEELTVNWKEANDTAARIGGWRAYAKEAQQSPGSDAMPSNAKPTGDARPAPAKP